MTYFDTDRMFTFLKAYATALDWTDTLNALSFARVKHAGQFRKGGQPYLVHPLTMACHAIAIGIKDDKTVAACLLHDVPEDCGVKPDEIPVSPETRESVRRLTRVKGEPLEPYYRELSEDRASAVAKILDCCNNVSDMAGVFSVEKIHEQIQEKRTFVLPLIRTTKDRWPDLGNQLFILKYHICSVIDGLEAALAAGQDQKGDDAT